MKLDMADDKLIQTITSQPESADGKAAKWILEYRKYCEDKRHNRYVLALTVILALSALAQIFVAILKTQ